MKSQLQDRKLQTSCKNCTFAIYNELTQTGCSADRIEKFNKSDIIEAYDNEKEFYVINNFCNLYRPLSWNGGSPSLEKAIAESALDFDIMVDCNHISESFKDYLIKTIPSISYYQDKLNINLFHDYSASSNIKSMVLDVYSHHKSIKISICSMSDRFLHEFALKSKRNCHLVLSESFDFTKLIQLNNLVNQDLKKFIVANCDGILIISNMAYKMNYANSQIDDYKSNINNIIETAKNIGMYIDI